MSERLNQLLRQRALLQEHLAWLNREIEEANRAAHLAPGMPGAPGGLVPFPPAPPSAPEPLASSGLLASSSHLSPSASLSPLPASGATVVPFPPVPPAATSPDRLPGLIAPVASMPPGASSGGATPLPAPAEAILERYRVDAGSVQKNVRKGCFMYFAAAMLLFVMLVALLYFTIGTSE